MDVNIWGYDFQVDLYLIHHNSVKIKNLVRPNLIFKSYPQERYEIHDVILRHARRELKI